LCQALISILGFNCSRRDRSARQVSVENAAARNSLKVDGRARPSRCRVSRGLRPVAAAAADVDR
jgi:hypothetical protein